MEVGWLRGLCMRVREVFVFDAFGYFESMKKSVRQEWWQDLGALATTCTGERVLNLHSIDAVLQLV